MPQKCASKPSISQSLQPSGSFYDCDLAIVGGGIVGLTLAAALKDSGLRVALIEAQPQSVAAAKGQAYALSLLSSQIFQGIGVWEQLRPRIAPFRKIRLSDADFPQAVHFLPQDLGNKNLANKNLANKDRIAKNRIAKNRSPNGLGAKALGYVGEHRALLETLQTFLDSCPNVRWFCPALVNRAEYHPDGVTLHLEQQGTCYQLRSRLLVAADGMRSRLRHQANIRTDGWQYWQSCIVATIRPEKPHQNIAYERFWSSGPFAILPLPNNRCRIVWTAPHAEAQALVALDDRQFLVELKRRYGNQMGNLELEGKRFIFPVRLMQSRRYVKPRLALVGDAAHCCHPVGGQGLNMGIRDAAALAQILQAAWKNNQDIGSLRVLKRYERWRKRENLAILAFTDFLVRCFSNRIWPLVILRRLGLLLMGWLRPLKRYFLQLMTGLRGHPPRLAQR